MEQGMIAEEAIKKIKEFGLHHAIEDLPHSALTVEAFKMAIEALENREEYRWHDIQKNPEDLPEGNDHRLVLVAYKFLKDDGYYYDLVKAGLVKPSKYIAAWTYIQKYERRKDEEDGRDNEDR